MKPGHLNKVSILGALALCLAGCGDTAPPEADDEPELEIEDSDVVVDNSALPGVTPMAERVATIGFLNKRNGLTRDLELSPGQEVRIGDARVRLRACETTAPWEDQPWTGAFVQLDVRVRGSERVERVFSGWVYRESPSLNVVEHPVYDVWVKSCAMTFPDGPDAEAEAEAEEPEPASSSASTA